MLRDPTGRFRERPFFAPGELDAECERTISRFLIERHGKVAFPILTEDLMVLLEQEASDVDPYADLLSEGTDVDGVTDFLPGLKPRVRISKRLSDPRYENRLRTTITHEFGHVKFHGFLYQLDVETLPLFGATQPSKPNAKCKRETILNAGQNDWMEWPAGYISGAMLMPLSGMRAIASGLEGKAPLSHDDVRAVEIAEKVQAEFRVSSDAARVRLAKLGFLTANSKAQPLPFVD